jgi:hypothetical protein
MNDTADNEHLTTSARRLISYRAERARSRSRARATLDEMADEARRYLGAVFTENDVITQLPVALVVRSDERLPDDYEAQTPRPTTDTLNRLIVEVLGKALTIAVSDAGNAWASGDANNVGLDRVTAIRVDAGAAATFLILGDEDPQKTVEIPFVRVLADLIDAAAQAESQFALAATTTSPAQPAAANA